MVGQCTNERTVSENLRYCDNYNLTKLTAVPTIKYLRKLCKTEVILITRKLRIIYVIFFTLVRKCYLGSFSKRRKQL